MKNSTQNFACLAEQNNVGTTFLHKDPEAGERQSKTEHLLLIGYMV
jgi:hypothetical protein